MKCSRLMFLHLKKIKYHLKFHLEVKMPRPNSSTTNWRILIVKIYALILSWVTNLIALKKTQKRRYHSVLACNQQILLDRFIEEAKVKKLFNLAVLKEVPCVWIPTVDLSKVEAAHHRALSELSILIICTRFNKFSWAAPYLRLWDHLLINRIKIIITHRMTEVSLLKKI